MMSSRGSRRFRRIVMAIALAVFIGYPLLFLHLASQGITRPDLLLDALLGGLAFWFLWYAGRVQAAPADACPACAGRMRRTRTTTGVRLWTCSSCGRERPRRRPRPAPGASG